MSFMLGCNYWASNAGLAMWHEFDAEVIEKDLQCLAESGVKYLRAFPLWSDFQPVSAVIGGQGREVEYTTAGKSHNPYYLDENMLERFELFLDLCQTYEMQVIVGIVTGWMSGGLFVPQVLQGKNVITDPQALYFTHLYIKGFVPRFCTHPAIYGWDLGNECNCMAEVKSRWQAAAWTASIAGSIRAEDDKHPIFFGYARSDG